MATRQRISVLLLVLAVAGIAAVGAAALGEPEPDVRVEVIAPLVDPQGFPDGGDEPMVAVLALAAEDGFSDGGDGLIRVLIEPVGFSDGGDLPLGFVRGRAPPAPDGFSDGGDGMIAVVAERVDSRELVTVLLPRAPEDALPPEGGDS